MILKIKCNRIWCIAVVVLVIATITAYCFNSLSPVKPRASEAYNVLGEAVPINKADVDNIRGVKPRSIPKNPLKSALTKL